MSFWYEPRLCIFVYTKRDFTQQGERSLSNIDIAEDNNKENKTEQHKAAHNMGSVIVERSVTAPEFRNINKAIVTIDSIRTTYRTVKHVRFIVVR